MSAHFQRYVAWALAGVAALVCVGTLLRPRVDAAVARLLNIATALVIMSVMVFPRTVAIDYAGIISERISSSVMGSQFFEPYFDVGLTARLVLTRAWHYFYALLCVGGIAVFFIDRDYRDRRKLYLFAIFAWIGLLLVAIPSRFEYYLLNLAGFSALFAGAAVCRIPRLVPAWATLLSVWAVTQTFGWLLLPWGIDRQSLYPFQTYDVVELANHRLTKSPLPILPEPPLPPSLALTPILQAAALDARGPFVLVVVPTPLFFTVHHHDTFRMYAMYENVAASVITRTPELQRLPMDPTLSRQDAEEQMAAAITQIPWYFLAQGKDKQDLERHSLDLFHQFFSRTPRVRLEVIEHETVEEGRWHFILYRVRLNDGVTPRRPRK